MTDSSSSGDLRPRDLFRIGASELRAGLVGCEHPVDSSPKASRPARAVARWRASRVRTGSAGNSPEALAATSSPIATISDLCLNNCNPAAASLAPVSVIRPASRARWRAQSASMKVNREVTTRSNFAMAAAKSRSFSRMLRTRALVSRYRSLIAQLVQDGKRFAGTQQWRPLEQRSPAKLLLGGRDRPLSHELTIPPFSGGQCGEILRRANHRDHSPAIGDLDGLPSLGLSQVAAEALL